MADVVVGGANEVVYLAAGTAVAASSGQSVGTGDVAVITPATAFQGRYLLLRFVETGATTDATFTLKAGALGGAANLAIYGDSAASAAFANGAEKWVQVDLARYLQADGTVRVAIGGAATAALTVSAVVLDKRAG